MPVVPIANPVSTVQRPLQPATITARPNSAGLEQFGAGLQRAGGAGADITIQELDRLNQAEVFAADTADAQDELAARKRLLEARGKGALEEFDALLEARAKKQKDIEGTLTNDVQKEAFRRRAAARSLEFQGWGETHVAKETERYEDEVLQANLATGMERVAASRNDFEGAREIVNEMVSTYTAHARLRGVPDEAIAQRNGQIRSSAMRRVVEDLVGDQNDLAASRLVDQYGKYLLDDDRRAVTKLLEIGGRDGTAQRMVDDWMSGGMKLGDLEQKLTSTPALQQDTKLRDEVQQRAIRALSLRDQARQVDQHEAYAQAYQIIQDPAKSYSDIPADLKARLEDRPDLDLHLRQLAAKTEKAERQTVTDKGVYYQLQTEAVTNPKAFAGRDLMTLATKLSDSDFKEMAKLQAEAKVGKGEKLDWLTSREDEVNQALAGLGIDPRPHHVEAGKVIANPQAVAFRNVIERRANARAGAAGRQTPNLTDVREAIADTIKVKVRLNVWGSDPEQVAAAVSSDERGKAYVPLDQIPAPVALNIRNMLRKAGAEPTDDRVQRYYAARLMEDSALLDAIEQER